MRPLGVVVGALVALAVTSAHAQPALDKASFTASPAELLEVARSAPTGDWPVTLLREESHLSFDARGRATRRWRLVFVVRTQAGVDDWGTLHHYWQPFYQERPEIRGRVIEPSGKVTPFDLSLGTEAPAVERSSNVFSDRRRIELPLPRFQIGAVIEEEIITRDRVALLSAGTAETFQLGRDMPVESELHTVSAPAGATTKVVTRGAPKSVAPRRSVTGGRAVWTLRLGRQEAAPSFETLVPGDVVQYPYLGVATGASWNAIARDYRKIVERRIADGPISLPPELPRAPTLDTVRAVVAWLHREIRYTGIEYGEASITPWPPAETMKRGFGDCKDKATLLVALLRQAGIHADLALLSTGPGVDVDPALPGMGVFDHAIVRARVDGRDVWIDATEDLYPVGALPPRDQGRRVLVIADDTRALQRTPKAPSSVREVRTFELAELGAARVTEVSHERGAFEADMRAWIRDTRADEVRKSLVSYVGREYLAKTLERYATTPPADLSTPFEVTVVGANAGRAYTERDHIAVTLFPSDLLEKLPDFLWKQAKDDETPDRRHPLELHVPHTYEIENRLVIPPGYELPSPVAERKRALGVMTFTEQRRLEGRTLVVTFRLETGTPRMTPAELKATRTALRLLAGEDVPIRIHHSGWALIDGGKPKHAIAEVERLVQLHPKEAIHHTQLAYVYLRAGAGHAARRAARKAVELEPGNADAHVVLGWVLRHDTLGREYGFDHDRAGALAAYRKARKLDPTHVGAAADLAGLLERDASGTVFGPGIDHAAAAEAWRAARALDDTPEAGLAIARALLHAGKYGEAEAIARELPSSEERDAMYIAAVALSRGASAAIDTANMIRAGTRVQLLTKAAATLTQLREYDRARALFAQAGTLSTGTPQAKLLSRIQRHPPAPGPGKDPASALHDFVYSLMVPSHPRRGVWDEHVEEALRTGPGLSALARLEQQVGAGFLWDMLHAGTQLTVEGRPNGPWRVDTDFVGQKIMLYIARDRGTAKVIAGREYLYGLGQHALRLLQAGDEAGARQCLDWARAELGSVPHLERLRFESLWGPGLATDRKAISFAAAVLAMDKAAIPVLQACASSVADARAICDASLASAYVHTERWAQLERHAQAWASRAREADARLAAIHRGTALLYLGNHAEAAAVYGELVARDAGDLTARRNLAVATYLQGKHADALAQLDDVIRRSDADAMDKNNLAWLWAGEGTELARARELAQAAVQASGGRTNALNTLAVVAAEQGDVLQARDEGWRSMVAGGRRTPGDEDWYLFGRIYEQLGLRDDAIAAYQRVTRPTRKELMPSSYTFARKRLAKLGVKLPAR